MAGYYYNRAAEGVHDDLHAKAIVLDVDGSRAALVACDLASLPRTVVEEARRSIAKDPGIAPERVMISATHAHTGPVVLGGWSRYNLEGTMAEIAQQYARDLPKKIAAAVVKANAALQPARAAAAVGHEDSISFNRRFFLNDGTVGWNPGKLNPKIVRPAGPIDPEAPVVAFRSQQGKDIAAYVNFALHLDTVGGLEYSADYPFTLSTALAAAKGRDLVTLFTIGCAGNVNHIDVTSKEPQKGHGEAARIGTLLAAAVLKAYRGMKEVDATHLDARSAVVTAPLAELPPGSLERSQEIAAKFGKPNAAPFLDFVQAFKVIDVAERKGVPFDAEVQVIRLGMDVAWVGLPGEIFVELGQAIKAGSPFRHTIVVELANGSLGYIPDRKAYPQGNYEVVSARVGAGSGELLVGKALALLGELFAAR
jgi:hypothetical protein